METLEQQTFPGFEDESMSSVRAFPVSQLPSPGSEKARAMTVGSGTQCSMLLSGSDPLSLCSKILLESSHWTNSEEFLHVWNRLDTRFALSAFQLTPLGQSTGGNGSSLLGTPSTASAGPNGQPSDLKNTLGRMALWPTPQAHDAAKGNPERVGRFGTKHGGRNLTDEVMVPKLLPTPTVQDGESTCGPSQLNRNSVPLNAMFGNSGSLNPRFVEELMGFPIDHTALKPLEIPLSPSKPIHSSKQSPKSMPTPVERIRAEMPLQKAWRILGLPGEAALNRDIRSPLREDAIPSFRLYQARDHIRWHDHGTGAGGDVIDLWAAVRQISLPEAIADILRYLGDGTSASSYTMPSSGPRMAETTPPPRPEPSDEPTEPVLWPDNMTVPTPEECRILGRLRKLSPEPFDLAGKLGTLVMGDKRGQRIWMTTDCRMRSAAMRRLDGQDLDLVKKKSASPRNAKRDWIIGTQTLNPALDQLKRIVLVEGEGDYYAALQLAIESEINFKVLAILGATCKKFHLDCQPQFVGAEVIIFPHNDRRNIGEESAKFWSGLFYRWGAKDVLLQHLPIGCDDLHDYLVQRPSGGGQLLEGFKNEL